MHSWGTQKICGTDAPWIGFNGATWLEVWRPDRPTTWPIVWSVYGGGSAVVTICEGASFEDVLPKIPKNCFLSKKERIAMSDKKKAPLRVTALSALLATDEVKPVKPIKEKKAKVIKPAPVVAAQNEDLVACLELITKIAKTGDKKAVAELVKHAVDARALAKMIRDGGELF